MAFHAAYWGKAYWYQSYQTLRSDLQPIPATIDRPSGGWYERDYRQEAYQRELIREQQEELRLVEQELANKEREKQRLESLKKAKKKAAEERAALLLLMEQEISRLRQRQIWLMRQIEEEEALLVLKMAAKRRLRLVAFN